LSSPNTTKLTLTFAATSVAGAWNCNERSSTLLLKRMVTVGIAGAIGAPLLATKDTLSATYGFGSSDTTTRILLLSSLA
jgi:hypothetical protein